MLHKLKPLSATVLGLMLSCTAHAHYPFADLPLHLQSESQTTGGGVKPNVLLLLDNSNSLSSMVDMFKGSIVDLLSSNHPYRNTIDFNVLPYFDQSSVTMRAEMGRRINASPWKFREEPDNLINKIRRLSVNGNTSPVLQTYVDALGIMRYSITQSKWRCQKHYIVMLSDGGQNTALDAEFGGNRLYPKYLDFNGGTEYTYKLKDADYRSVEYSPSQWESYMPNIAMNSGGRMIWLPSAGKRRYYATWEKNSPNAFWIFANYAKNTDFRRGGKDSGGGSWDDPEFPIQNIETYSIAYKSRDYKEPTKTAYNRASVSNNMKAFEVNSKQDLANAFETIFKKIQQESVVTPPTSFSTVSPALAGSGVTTRLPNLAAAVFLDIAKGSSQIRLYQLNHNNDGSFNVDTNYTTPDVSGNQSGQREVVINYKNNLRWFAQWSFNGLGLNNWDFMYPAQQTTSQLIPWLVRSGTDNAYPNLRKRQNSAERDMGDVIGSSLVMAGKLENKRQKFMITAANDGMVYLFQSQNDSKHPYTLKKNYVPSDVQRENPNDLVRHYYKDIADPQYGKVANKPHRYLINGGMVVRTMDNRTDDPQIFMVGNLGQGGRGLYALNVGGTSRDKTPKKVGLEDSGFNSLHLFDKNDMPGYTIGSSQIGRVVVDTSENPAGGVKKLQYAIFSGSGLRNHEGSGSRTSLFVFNALTNTNVGTSSDVTVSGNAGDLLREIPVPDGDTSGLMQPTLLDMDFNGSIDVAYALSYSGHLYRFDLRDRNPANWKAYKLFETKARQFVTSAPALSKIARNQYVVIFGTGSDLFQEDVTDRTNHSAYGIFDDLSINEPTQVNNDADSLLEQRIEGVSGSTQYRNVSANEMPVDDATKLPKKKGWVLNLPQNSGERITVKPTMLLKTVVFITRKYSSKTSVLDNAGDQCKPSTTQTQSSSESWIMQVKGDTGGMLPPNDDRYAYIDWNGSTIRDAVTGQVKRGTVYAGSHSDSIASLGFVSNGGDASKVGNMGSAYSPDGDAGGTGQDIKPNDNPSDQDPRHCFDADTNFTIVSESGAAQGVNNPKLIFGKICSQSVVLRRLSWREIF